MRLPLLSVTPRIAKYEDSLVARTSLLGLLLTLTFLHRTVIVDPQKKSVVIRHRLFWCLASERRIPFKRVESLSYDYEDWNPSTGMGFTGDTTDCFTVKLNLTDGKQVHLFHFVGEGTFINNSALPDWMYWSDFAFDAAGDQADKSRAYVTVLQQLLKVPLR
ncbi:MAG: hypothetical protein HON53_16805 [Planctomycetaceae bacterium]|nr:hypothetical protein [Planctomycetaceae bacterium]MBT6155047.1 hypothetical protein [Planctomycetaceae bacterium]MBT6485723.1 hypothetical protein [Planctomycetaceae bacterium]MBT6496504.1 hypothetical protein [Planctomycetaceae bacterium]